MHKKGMKSLVSLMLAAMLVVLAGCQTIAGVDLKKMVQQNVGITSGESNLFLSVELLTKEGYEPSEEEAEFVNLLKSLKLSIDSVKTQDSTHASMKGSLSFQGTNIPFHLVLDESEVLLHILGAKKPFVLGSSLDMGMNAAAAGLPEGFEEHLKDLEAKMQELMPEIIQFFLTHMPDLEKVSVSKVNDTINGEKLDLTKVHIELNGVELVSLLKQLLKNIAADEEGLRKIVESYMDAMLPIIQEVLNTDPELAPVAGMLQNKELVMGLVMPELVKLLNDLSGDLGQIDASDKAILSGIGLNMDLYLDKDLYSRKTEAALTVNIPEEEQSEGITGFVIHMSTESWNINQPVTMDKINTANGTVPIDENMSLTKFMANFHKNSAVYKLLDEQLNAAGKQAFLTLTDVSEANAQAHPYKKNGNTTMVPTRYLLEQLDAEVLWDKDSKTITIIDPLTEKTIVSQVGSKEADVNGQQKVMPVEVEQAGGYSFLPLRFVANELGFKVEWIEEENLVIISR